MERHDNYLGKRLEGRYEVQELIGTGGMANVYKAYDIIDQQTVAVKILRDEFLSNTEFLRRFKNESKAIAVLSHPNIVRVFDVSFTNRVHSIVMEFIDGITLKDYIEQQGALSWKDALHFTVQILRALQHAHDKGIVHRDIKPQNIMLLQDGAIKVTDFGIARFARSEVKTITDRAIGSVHYISPEQAMGENTDEKSDVYSVGVMLFEMLTGRLPFEADTAVSVALKQIQTQATRPREINPAIPEGLEDITLKAMQKDAANRYPSAAAMISDIESFKQNPSIHFEYKYLQPGPQNKNYRQAIQEAREDDNLQSARFRRKTPYLPILTGVTVAFVLASIAFVGLIIYMNNPFTKVPEHEVPNLVGIKFDSAKETYLEFELVQETTGYSDEHGPGVIYEQDPKPGRQLKEGATVKVKVSTGQRVITLENFSGKDASQTKLKLEDLGLVVEEEKVYSADVAIGCVVYTDPSAGFDLNSGSTVTIYTSLGPDIQLTTIPDVKGLTLERARELLEMYNVRIGSVSYDELPEPAGTVVGQDPDSGALLPQGTDVNLLISSGNDSGFKRVAITVPLPEVSRDITIQAYRDGTMVQQEVLNPSQVAEWRPAFEGSDQIIEIDVYIDNELYMEFELDFESGLFVDVTDGKPGFDRNARNNDDDDDDGITIPRDDH